MTKNNHYREIRLVLGDQLNANHTWFKSKHDDVLYVIAELHQEMHYCTHHIQKVIAFFAAMERFAHALQHCGHHVLHLTLDDTRDFATLPDLLANLLSKYQATQLSYQLPDEYRLRQQMSDLAIAGVDVRGYDSEHFMLGFEELTQYFKADTHHTMEQFYRKMRKRFNVLMQDGKPLGEQWNFDKDNRNKLKAQDINNIPEPLCFDNDIKEILARIHRHNIKTIGTVGSHLLWPVNRQQALQLLDYFCAHLLPLFGTFQDAMTCQSDHKWSLYHSRLSFALNAKILHPLQVIQAAVDAYHDNDKHITLAQVEGFVRQILGWREYVRGIYWLNMPAYANKNNLEAKRSLPDFFWSGDTKMKCLQQAISQSLEYGYAHHIQRLMITGNFCLLLGVNPDEVDAWYLGIYVDAIEWVEMPNTRGMSQFADGGIIATKPYCAGGNYVNKMSDYCKSCHYKVSEKTSASACPLNSLYWHFMDRHRARFGNNHRIGMIYRNWDKQSEEARNAVLGRAQWCIGNIEQL
ncbi:cryptochrome/photolyase family protein [Pseudoalteromonas sp. SSDWG2]|uniref:cryptochrome/photolyase family protein n=1 Tax=Pseudoalteromonas sp. SSDWG2 TaxID=3139391 RepID=UPI003BAB0712